MSSYILWTIVHGSLSHGTHMRKKSLFLESTDKGSSSDFSFSCVTLKESLNFPQFQFANLQTGNNNDNRNNNNSKIP